MYSSLNTLPAEEQKRELALIQKEVREGTHNPLPILMRQVNNREKNRQRNQLTLGVSGAFLGMVILGSTFNLTPGLIGALGGSVLLLTAYPAHKRYSEVKTAIGEEDLEVLVDFLTEEELKDLDNFQQKFTPKTEESEYSHGIIKSLCNSAFVEEERQGAIVVPHKEVLPLAEGKGEDMSNLPGFTEPNPWVEKKAKNGLKKITLAQDTFVDQVQDSVRKSSDKMIGSRLDEFEEMLLLAIEAANGKKSDSEPGEFDPSEPEEKDEFSTYKNLVELEGMSPRGQKILFKMWGVIGGSNKKANLARDRRDQFADRLDILDAPESEFRLYGE